jgi:hypothetical protein
MPLTKQNKTKNKVTQQPSTSTPGNMPKKTENIFHVKTFIYLFLIAKNGSNWYILSLTKLWSVSSESSSPADLNFWTSASVFVLPSFSKNPIRWIPHSHYLPKLLIPHHTPAAFGSPWPAFSKNFFFAVLDLNSGPPPWATPPTLFLWWVFQNQSCELFAQGRLWTTILLISASIVARITGMSQWHSA